MYCKECWEQIPDDSNFCNKCGAPQRAGLTAATTETSWETGHIRCKVTTYKSGFLLFSAKCTFLLEAIGPQGSYTAETSPEFEYNFHTLDSDPRADPGFPYVDIHEGETAKKAFDEFLAQITGAGWLTAPVTPNSWFQHHFRRRVK